MNLIFEPSQPMPKMQAPVVRLTPRGEHGAIIEDGVQKATTLRCPHCGGHFLYARGNFELAKHQLGDIARPKVYCTKCDRLTCGRPGCNPEIVSCVPLEARLEYREGTPDPRYAEAIRELEEKKVPIL